MDCFRTSVTSSTGAALAPRSTPRVFRYHPRTSRRWAPTFCTLSAAVRITNCSSVCVPVIANRNWRDGCESRSGASAESRARNVSRLPGRINPTSRRGALDGTSYDLPRANEYTERHVATMMQLLPIAVLILILFSALLAASETAIFSLSRLEHTLEQLSARVQNAIERL